MLAAEAEEFTAIWKELDTEAGRQSFFKERAAQRDEIAAVRPALSHILFHFTNRAFIAYNSLSGMARQS